MTARGTTIVILGFLAGTAQAQSAAESHQKALAQAAEAALRAPDAETRNRIHAEAVAQAGARLAARAAGVTGRSGAHLERVFRSAALEAGRTYTQVEGGRASTVAFAHLPAALAALDGRALPNRSDRGRAASLIRRVRVEDVLRLTANQLGTTPAPEYATSHLIEQMKHAVPTSDPFRASIDRFPRRAKHEKPLTQAELKALDVAVRLLDTTVKSGLIHDAAARDLLRSKLYELPELRARRLYTGTRKVQLDRLEFTLDSWKRVERAAEARALGRVAFETYKYVWDLDTDRRTATDAEAARTRRRLARAYADELRTKTLPQLITEARAAGVDLQQSKVRLNRLAIASLLTGLTTAELRRAKPVQGARGRLKGLIPGRSSKRRVRGR